MRNGPVQIAILLLIAIAGCRSGEGGEGNKSAAPASGAAGGGRSGGEVQTATLTGLYEGGSTARRNQLCMIQREGRGTSFGFVTWGSGDTNCSGSGTATREGNVLRLRLDGDESCALEARIDGRKVTLPTNIPAQCQEYYCGRGAQMSGATFDKVAGEQADALRAADLVGDPLCGG
jgi:hypothetical protein